MRKTTTFMIVIALIGVLCSSVFLFTAKHARFPLKNEQGNRSVLKNIPFDSIVSLNDASILVSYDNDTQQHHEIKKSQKDPSRSSLNFTYVRDDDCKPISDWQKAQEQYDASTPLYERKLNQAKLYLSVMYTDKNNNFKDLGFIQTELIYKADEQHILKEQAYYEKGTNGIASSSWIEPENFEGSEEWSQPVYYHGYYYILPPSTISMSGYNYIYRAKERESVKQYAIPTQDQNYYSMDNRLDVEKLTKLRTNRNYLALRISSNHLIVFSQKDNQLYITKYDDKGNQIKEITINNNSYLSALYQNDEYICFIYDNKLQVLNTDSMKVKATENSDILSKDTDGNSVIINDILYKNGKIYVSMYKDADYFINTVIVMDFEKTLYIGTLDLLHVKTNAIEMPAINYPVTFRR